MNITLRSLVFYVFAVTTCFLSCTCSHKNYEAVKRAQMSYQKEHGEPLPDRLLRNLEIHNFYPATLGEEINNVLVATTTNGRRISPPQNYSSLYVDFGVIADSVGPDHMKFQVPFTTSPLFISGSSFATAILTGKIGAFTNKAAYVTDLNKQTIINSILSSRSGIIRTSTDLESRNLVRDGRIIKRE